VREPVGGRARAAPCSLACLARRQVEEGPALAGGKARVRIFGLTAPDGGATARGMPAPNHPNSHSTHSDQPPATQAEAPNHQEPGPTAKQLAYLRALADRAGQTFTYPRTRRQASAEIRRLRAQKPTSRVERRLERRQIADAIARGPHDAAGIDLDRDVTGYGSTATWR
jgi:hypothetical protein